MTGMGIMDQMRAHLDERTSEETEAIKDEMMKHLSGPPTPRPAPSSTPVSPLVHRKEISDEAAQRINFLRIKNSGGAVL